MKHLFLLSFLLTRISGFDINLFTDDFLVQGIQSLDSRLKEFRGKQFYPRDECRRLLEEFSSAVSNYTQCSVRYARPVNFCLQCKRHYLLVKTKFEEMEHYFQDGITCKEVLTKQDNLDIVTSIYKVVTDDKGIWALGNCPNCYKYSDPNYGISEEARVYVQLLQETWNCFGSYTNFTVAPGISDDDTDFSSLCGNCSESYFDTRKYFWESLIPSTTGKDYGSVCIDLKDAYNFTGYVWGVEFSCNSELDMGAFWILILIPFGILIGVAYGVPVLFVPWYHGSKHKVLTLLAIVDHYDRVGSDDHSSLRHLAESTRKDSEEPLSVEAEEREDLEEDLFKLVRRLKRNKEDLSPEEQDEISAQIMEILFDLSEHFPEVDDDESCPDESAVVRRRRKQSGRQPVEAVNLSFSWSDFKPYLEEESTSFSPDLNSGIVEIS